MNFKKGFLLLSIKVAEILEFASAGSNTFMLFRCGFFVQVEVYYQKMLFKIISVKRGEFIIFVLTVTFMEESDMKKNSEPLESISLNTSGYFLTKYFKH